MSRRQRAVRNQTQHRALRQRSLTLETLEQRLLLAADPIITEFLASNSSGLVDGNGNTSDWIEIYNAGDAAIDLEGWHLTDNAANLDKWTFPDLPVSELDPGEYLVVFASSIGTPDLAGNLHTNFSLSAAGEYVGLVRPNLTVASEYGLGGADYPEQRSDVSYGVQGSVPPTNSNSITYIDADEEPGGNTAGLYGGWTPRGLGAGADANNFGNEGGTLQGFGGESEIATTATGLDANQTYDVFAFFWDADGGWNIAAGLTSGALSNFTTASPGVFVIDSTTQIPGTSEFVTGLNVLGEGSDTYDDWVDGNRTLYAAPLGQIGGSTSATVYIDHFGGNPRTFYDGIGVRPTGGLVERESLAEYLIPTDGSLGTSWTSNTFDAAANGFTTGQASVGYENNPSNNDDSFADEIATTLPAFTTNVYVRTQFDLEDASEVTGLTLSMKYDDGFVAYLNGVPVASQFAPANPAWNSLTGNTGRSDQESLEYQDFSLGAHLGALEDGTNTLAIHAINGSTGSSDFLMSPRLTLSTGTLDLGEIRYLDPPTPGTINGQGVEGFVGDTTFDVDRGFFTAPFNVVIATPDTPTADIYYTLDGTVPAPSNPSATLYTSAVSITTTTNLRAKAFIDGFEPSNVDTQTYVFLDDVFGQDPLGNPQNGLSYPTTWQGGFSADYEIDSRVVTQWDDNNPGNTDFGIREALQSLPTMSLTLPHEDLWGTGSNGSGGIYPNSTSEGSAWKRAGSVEYFDPATGDQFQENVGITIQGAASRDNNRLKKHSFRLIFNKDFDGPGKLHFPLFDNSDFDDIDTVSLKASFTDAFPTRTSTNRYSPLDSTYSRDVWMRDTQLAMGNPVADSTYVHLYINGLYWGLYWPAERNDDEFLAGHIGGQPEDWDIVRDFNELFRGERTAYDQMFALSRAIDGASASTADDLFQAIQGKNPDGSNDPATDALLDVDNFIDYMVLHLYAGVEDWPSHNWYAARNRVDPGDGFIFMTWDQEIALDQLYRDRTSASNANTPGELFQNLRNSSEFRLRFADRVEKHLFNDGVLTTPSAQDRWMQRADQIEAGIIGESARWGDTREGENITAYTSLGPFNDGQIPTGSQTVPLMTVDHWRDSIDYVRDSFLVNAGGLLINRLLCESLYVSLDAPTLKINNIIQHGGLIAAGSNLSISAPGAIYYTLDGSDPRAVGGAATGTAYNGAVSLDATTVVKARTFSGGQWSPLTEAVFTVANSSLVISEFNYNPYAPTTPAELAIPGIDNDDFEFIELMNTHPTDAINLQNVQLGGSEVSFTFGNVVLAAGERIVVVEDVPAFEARYGTSVNVAGKWTGKLNNGGGEITLLNGVGETVQSIDYNDRDPWSKTADGAGATLVLDDPAGTPANQLGKYYRWRGSAELGGTPGAASAPLQGIVINEVLAHTDAPDLDSIELYNPTGASIDIGGWYLSDSDSDFFKYQIPGGTTLGAGQYVVFNEDDFNPTPAMPGPKDFALDAATGDDVWLTVPNVGGTSVEQFVDQVSFDGTLNGESVGRVPNGVGRLAPLKSLTLGAANSAPRVGAVVISEVNYHPVNPTTAAQNAFQALAPGQTLLDDDLEFIEIYNPTSATVDLTNWELNGESDFAFAAGTMLASQSALVVVTFDPVTDAARLAGFRAHYGIGVGVPLVGAASGHLNNSFGRVELEMPDDPPLNNPMFYPLVTADEVLYDDLAPWTTVADGLGPSLGRTTASAYGNFASSWIPIAPSPGSASLTLDSADFNDDGIVNGFDFLTWQRGFGTTTGANHSQGDANSDTAVNAIDLSVWNDQYGTDPAPIVAALSAATSSVVATEPQPVAAEYAGDVVPTGVWIDFSGGGNTGRAGQGTAVSANRHAATDHVLDAGNDGGQLATALAVDSPSVSRHQPQPRDTAFERWSGVEELLEDVFDNLFGGGPHLL